MRKLYILILLVATFFLVNFIDSIVGNPLHKSLATSYAKQFVAQQFDDGQYTFNTVGYNYDTKMYDYIISRKNGDDELSYVLTINSGWANRSVDAFTIHPSLLNTALSERLSNEAKVHVTNIVRNIIPTAKVEYQLFVPKTIPENAVWSPGVNLDLNASIYINDTVENWNEESANDLVRALKEQFVQNGIHYSTLSIRIAEEYEKNGITYFKTVYKQTLFEKEL